MIAHIVTALLLGAAILLALAFLFFDESGRYK